MTEEVGVTETTLIITISHKTANEMAMEYGFDAGQLQQLTELLAEENSSLWNTVLYGMVNSTGDGNIVMVALSQLGNVGGQPYWSWYGFSSRVEWCACFVSWCGEQAGLIESGAMPKFSLCENGIAWFKSHGKWQETGGIPSAGSLVFFDWNGDGISDHVGIVEKYEGGIIYTVEGNTGTNIGGNNVRGVWKHSYSVGSATILGYGII